MCYIADLLFYLFPFAVLFAVGGFVSDFILPHIKWLNDWIDTLPMMRGEE